MEKDLLQQWKQQRSSERILEIDIPLSYGVFEIIHPDEEINKGRSARERFCAARRCDRLAGQLETDLNL